MAAAAHAGSEAVVPPWQSQGTAESRLGSNRLCQHLVLISGWRSPARCAQSLAATCSSKGVDSDTGKEGAAAGPLVVMNSVVLGLGEGTQQSASSFRAHEVL